MIIPRDGLHISRPEVFSTALRIPVPLIDFALAFLHRDPFDLSPDSLLILLVDTVKTKKSFLYHWVQTTADFVRTQTRHLIPRQQTVMVLVLRVVIFYSAPDIEAISVGIVLESH